MHQRLDGSRNRLPEHVVQVEAALQGQWSTVQQLADVLDLNVETVKFAMYDVARRRAVCSRKTTLKFKPREYRLFLEAHQVRSV